MQVKDEAGRDATAGEATAPDPTDRTARDVRPTDGQRAPEPPPGSSAAAERPAAERRATDRRAEERRARDRRVRDRLARRSTAAGGRSRTPTEHLDREFWTLASLAAATARHRSPEEIAEAALAVLVRATSATSGVIIVLEGDRYDVVASTGISSATADLVEQVGRLGGRMAAAVGDPAAVVVTSLDDAPFNADIKAAVESDGVRFLLFTGLWVASRLVGIIGIGWAEEPVARPSDPAMLQAAVLVAAAVEHGRLDARLNRAYETEHRITTGLQTLVRLTRLTSTARDEASFAQLALGEIARTLEAAGGLVLKVDGDAFEWLAARDLSAGFRRLAEVRRVGEWGFIRRLREGAGPFIERFADSTSAETVRVARRSGYDSYAVVPVRGDARLDAVLVLLFSQPKDDLPIDSRTLGAVERVLEIAFSNQRLRRAVAAGERRYRSLFERSPVGIIVSRTDGTIVDANVAAEAIYGYGSGDLVGRPMRELSADPPASVQERATVVIATGGGRFETRGRRADGTAFPAVIHIAGIEVDGQTQYVLIIRDLSERHRLEDELVQAQKMDAIGQLVAGVAHELNNPLASIIGFSQLIRDDDELPDNLRDNAQLLASEADRTRRIVGNLLDFARRRPPERAPSSVSALVRSVVDLSAYTLRAARIDVRIDVPNDLPLVPIDRAQLQQVLLNLTTNSTYAIRSAERPGRLTFRARRARTAAGRPPMVRLTVADDGPGIAPELRDRLFVPFFTTKPPGAGTGLGLPVSAGIVSSHGGRLSFEPGRPRGARFHIDLPLHATVEHAAAEAQRAADLPAPRRASTAPAQVRPTTQPDAGTPRVVVVDDEPAIRIFLDKALRETGFDPVVVATGEEAVAAVERGGVAAILCDYRIDGFSGTEVFDRVTTLEPGLGRHFAFMSGDVLNPELHEFATRHGIALLAKPFDVATVERVVADAVASDGLAVDQS